MEKKEYAKWNTEKLLANVKLNKVVKAIIIGMCIIGFSCFLLCCSEIIEEYFWICVLVPIIIALYLWGMFALFNIELKKVKEELKKRQYSKKDELAADKWLKKFYTAMLILLIVCVAVSLGTSLGTSLIKKGDESKCTICDKPASHSFQGSGYCGEHYNDAVRWAIDNVSE
ncbi:MAG: hypothetical protein E7403_01805 [Ruminococcaceae bacterium]|nr:hypothetical protein [Oscillospiraceae bacterium]